MNLGKCICEYLFPCLFSNVTIHLFYFFILEVSLYKFSALLD